MKLEDVFVKPVKNSIREIIGNKLSDWATDIIAYIEIHEMRCWVIGMVLTAIGLFLLVGDITEIMSFIMIVLLAIMIPGIGWMMMYIVVIIPCMLLYLLGLIILHPLKSLFVIICILVAVLLVYCTFDYFVIIFHSLFWG